MSKIIQMEPKQESKEEFFERPFEEMEDGFYDERGFYTTPNGSFWDDDKVYFNHLGFDKHGGSYDKYGVYLPGPNWNEEYNCYDDELNKNQDTDKIYSQVLDNLKEELVEDYAKNEKVLKEEAKKKAGDNDGDEDDEQDDLSEELTEEQMKEIFDQAMKKENELKTENDNQVKSVTKISVGKSDIHQEVKENTHENVV